MSLREETLQEVEAVLGYEGQSPAAVHARVGCWSRATIINALRELVAQNRATFDGADCRRLYRRKSV